MGNLFEPIKNENFDLIIFNPPIFQFQNPNHWRKNTAGLGWDPDGRKIIDRSLDKVENYLKLEGRFIFVQSSLSNAPKTLNKLERENFEVQTKVKNFLSKNCTS